MPALKQNRARRDVDQSGPNDEHGTVIRLPVSQRRSRRHGPPPRQRNVDRRKREYLTPAEVQTLMGAARGRGRQGHRGATMILVAYQHWSARKRVGGVDVAAGRLQGQGHAHHEIEERRPFGAPDDRRGGAGIAPSVSG